MILRVNYDNKCSIWSQKVKDGEVSNFYFYYRKIDKNLKFRLPPRFGSIPLWNPKIM